MKNERCHLQFSASLAEGLQEASSAKSEWLSIVWAVHMLKSIRTFIEDKTSIK